ncbi:MAG: ABC transporter substrate-binding protein, partial [Actinobacteria bacterium]|nr:ABC transporter substrate-binding protein [Actinomycetota bacterium]
MHHPRIIRTMAVALALIVATTFGLAGCASSEDSTKPVADSPAVAFPVTVTDDAGREVTIESAPERIVSLAPANTEIVYALGLLDKLVGVTTYDDYPAQVADIAKIGDFVTPNIEAITAAQPDLILATTGVQADVITQLEGTGATVIAIDPQTLEALYVSIETVGKATGATEMAAELLDGMKADI